MMEASVSRVWVALCPSSFTVSNNSLAGSTSCMQFSVKCPWLWHLRHLVVSCIPGFTNSCACVALPHLKSATHTSTTLMIQLGLGLDPLEHSCGSFCRKLVHYSRQLLSRSRKPLFPPHTQRLSQGMGLWVQSRHPYRQ